MKGWRYLWWGKFVKILIVLWVCLLMIVRVESCWISFGKLFIEYFWKKGLKLVKGECDVFILDLVNLKWWGNFVKYYIIDIDIYEFFYGKIIFLEKVLVFLGKFILVYLYLDYIFVKKKKVLWKNFIIFIYLCY